MRFNSIVVVFASVLMLAACSGKYHVGEGRTLDTRADYAYCNGILCKVLPDPETVVKKPAQCTHNVRRTETYSSGSYYNYGGHGLEYVDDKFCGSRYMVYDR